MTETTTIEADDTFVSLTFCSDCAMFHANGEVPADWADVAVSDWLGYIAANLEGLHGIHVGDDHDEFSTSSCDSCGSMLAGYRCNGGAWLDDDA